MSYFPPDIVVPKVTRSYTNTPFTLYQPFAHTNCSQTLLSLMLYHIGTLFQNWLFLPFPSLNTLLNSIIICTNFYTLLSMYLLFRMQSILAMLFCTLCFRKKFHRKKKKELVDKSLLKCCGACI